MNSTIWTIYEIWNFLDEYATTHDLNPYCKRNRSFINQLYIELGLQLNLYHTALIILTAKLIDVNGGSCDSTLFLETLWKILQSISW